MHRIRVWLIRSVLPVLLLAGGLSLTTSTPSVACTCARLNYEQIAKDAPLIVIGAYYENQELDLRDDYGRVLVHKVEKGPKSFRRKKNGLRTIHYRPRTPSTLDDDGMTCSYCGRYFPLESGEPERFFMKPDPKMPGFYNVIQNQSLTDEEIAALSR